MIDGLSDRLLGGADEVDITDEKLQMFYHKAWLAEIGDMWIRR